MAKNSDALIFTLGVDTTQLFNDLNDTTKSLTEKVKEANQTLKANKLKFEAEIETAKANKDYTLMTNLIVAKREQVYKVNEEILTQYREAYSKLTEAEQKEASIGGVLDQKISKQSITVAKAKQALNEYVGVGLKSKSAIGALKTDAVEMLNILNPAASKAIQAADAIISKYKTNINAIKAMASSTSGKGALGLAAGIGGIYGLDSLIDSVASKATATAEKVEGVSRAAQALGLSSSDYGKISTLGKLSGVDINPVIARIAELNKAISTAGEKGNETTKILDRWGISLRNNDGTYKAFNVQLAEIAKGYQTALASGKGYAYSVEVLGNSLKGALPLLKDYSKYNEESSKVQKTGLGDSAKAQQLADLKRLYDTQQAQVGGIVGNAGLDVGIEYYQKMLEIKQREAEIAKANKDNIKALAEMALMWEKASTEIMGMVVKVAGEIAKVNVGRVGLGGLAGAAVGGAIGTLIGPVGTLAGAKIGGMLGASAAGLSEFFASDDEKITEQATKATETQQATAEAIGETSTALLNQSDAASKVNETIEEQLYKLTHSDYENELKTIYEAYQNNLSNGADSNKAQALYELQKQQIDNKYAEKAAKVQEETATRIAKEQEEAQKKVQETAEASAKKGQEAAEARKNAENEINAIFESDYQKRIAEIEEQKNKWIQACADEAKATEAAEEQKRQARESEAERYLRSQSELIKRAAKLEKSGMTSDEVTANLQSFALKQEYKNLGLTAGQIDTGAKYIGILDKITDFAKTTALAPITQKLANTANNITVNIDSPMVQDSQSIATLAEKVAGKINEAIDMKGALNNGY